MISRRTAVIGFMAGVLLASRSRAAQPQLPASSVQRVTFSADIAPILFRNCASCHHAGEAGPFPLVSYGDAKKHARQIAEVTRLRIMPPWLPEPGEAKFTDEQRLSTEQIASIGNWVEQGALEGNRHGFGKEGGGGGQKGPGEGASKEGPGQGGRQGAGQESRRSGQEGSGGEGAGRQEDRSREGSRARQGTAGAEAPQEGRPRQVAGEAEGTAARREG